jgi:hypothetical protein
VGLDLEEEPKPRDFLKDYEKPEYVLKFEEMLKCRAEYREKSMELVRARVLAEANQLLDPNLISESS